MKMFLLTTNLGHFALEFRDKVTLVKAALLKPESVGTSSNDILSSKLITKICLSEKVFLDIGAHIGSIISEVQRYDHSIKITGIEAIPEKIVHLKKNFRSVQFYECALGNESKMVTFYINKQRTGYSSLLAPPHNSTDEVKEILVELKKLDDLQNFEDVDAIKIDVEGAELEVIKGGKETIIRNKPIIMFESSTGDNKIKAELWELFDSLNFGIHLPNRLAHNDKPLTLECFLDSHVYPRFTTNYFAVPIERRLEFRDRARKILKLL